MPLRRQAELECRVCFLSVICARSCRTSTLAFFWDSGIGYLLWCSVIFAPETLFAISAVLAQGESVVLPPEELMSCID
jgi:hypothetical protein